MDGAVFFAATDASGDRELWKTDGTVAGTARVRDINTGAASSYPGNLTAVGETLYFTVGDTRDTRQLWKTDGTEAGTVRVSGIYVEALVNFNRVPYFRSVGFSGRLYRVDADGVRAVPDAPDGVGALEVMGDALYFTSRRSGSSYRGIFRTDGGAASLVKEIDYGGGNSTSAGELFASGELLYFLAGPSISPSRDLWRSDGTAAGTIALTSGLPLNHSRPLTPAGGNSILFARSTPQAGVEPWVSAGTVAGTRLLKDLVPGPASGWTYGGVPAVRVGGRVLFTSVSGTKGTELWKTDLTTAGTVLVKDVSEAGPYLWPLGVLGNQALLSGGQFINHGNLFRSDGTAAGTVRVGATAAGNGTSMWDYVPSSYAPAPAFFRHGELMYFSARDGSAGGELWRTRAGGGGAQRVPVPGGGVLSLPGGYTPAADGSLYFSAAPAASGAARGLYRVPPGGSAAESIWGGVDPRYLSPVSNALYFTIAGTTTSALWRYDPAGPTLAPVRYAQYQLTQSSRLLGAGGQWFFTAAAGASAVELWRTDGTAAVATPMSSVLGPSPAFSSPKLIASVGDAVYFSARDTAGEELWRSDGTRAGTSRVSDITPGAGSTSIGQAYVHNGVLYFDANGKLWQSDGTAAGTRQVGDLSLPRQLMGSGADVYLTAADGSGRSVFRTDGTAAGTVRLTDPGSGDAAFQAGGLHAAGGYVYVVGLGGTNRERFELWRMGAAPGSAVRLRELSPRVIIGGGPMTGYWGVGISALASNSTHLFFPAYRPEWGMEPHVMPLSEPPGAVSGTVYDDRNRNGVRDAGEAGLAGRTVFVDYDADAIPDPDEPSATTGAGGAYTIAGLDARAYTVRQVLPEGFGQTAPAGGGGRVVTIAQQPVTGVDFGSTDIVSPEVSTSAFDFAAPPMAVRVVFSEDVAGTVAETDLQAFNLTTTAPVPPQWVRVSYDSASRTASFTFPGYPGGVLPNGNYRATLAAGSVADASGNLLVLPHALEFFVLQGDINRDRRVDGSDFATLAGSFGKTGMTYAQGDLNDDGRVDGSDFALLAGNFGKTVPAPQAAALIAPAAAGPTPAAPARRPAPSIRRTVAGPAKRPAARRRIVTPAASPVSRRAEKSDRVTK